MSKYDEPIYQNHVCCLVCRTLLRKINSQCGLLGKSRPRTRLVKVRRTAESYLAPFAQINTSTVKEVAFCHYRNLGSLEKSAFRGCHLCALLWRDGIVSHPGEVPGLLEHSYRVILKEFRATKPADHSGVLGQLVLDWSGPDAITGPYLFDAVLHDSLLQRWPYSEPGASSLQADRTSSSACFQVVRTWINECIESHLDCKRLNLQAKRMPSRLLKLTSLGKTAQIRLIPTEKLVIDGNYPQYLTLSHCWGICKILTLKEEFLESFQDGVPFEELPKTFADAVIITLSLGYSCLWIDSLCIIQDNPADWLKEAALMGDVYQGAVCTIAALGADDSQGGCFVKRHPLAFRPCQVANEIYAWPQRSAIAQNRRGPSFFGANIPRLNTRAWVLQERVLSPRTIFYGADMLYWECGECVASEHNVRMQSADGQRGPNFTIPVKSKLKALLSTSLEVETDQLSQLWCYMLFAYTQARMTFASDKWIALAGVANKIAGRCNSRLIAGMWEADLISELLWKTQQPGHRLENGSPSWSWISLDAPVSIATPDARKNATVIAQITSIPPNCDKEIQWNSEKGEKYCLSVCAPLTKLRWEDDSAEPEESTYVLVSANDEFLKFRAYLDVSLPFCVEVWCLYLESTTREDDEHFVRGLLIVNVDPVANEWQRVGQYQCIVAGDKFGLPRDILIV
jgi:Heterokaryon incompatibility protein (HET)